MQLSVGTKLGPHEIAASLGAGATEEVHKARDKWLNRDMAIKVLPDTFANDETPELFQREARGASVARVFLRVC
jgi:serine/threonine protein kinase